MKSYTADDPAATLTLILTPTLTLTLTLTLRPTKGRVGRSDLLKDLGVFYTDIVFGNLNSAWIL